MNPDLQNKLAVVDAALAANGEVQPSDGGEPAAPEIELVWDRELYGRNTPLPPSLIEGYINRGEVSILAGASKAGKSWLALQMAKSIGAGIKFLDRKTTPGTCLYLNTEVAAPFWELRSREMNDKLALTEPPSVLHASTRGQDITVRNVIPLLEQALEKVQLATVDFVVVDPWYTLAAGLDENAAGEVSAAMLEFQRLAERMEAGVLITHHFAKGNATSKTMLDRASGSGVFARSVDNFFTLTENASGKMVLEATRRNAASPPPMEVSFDFPIWKRVGDAEAILPPKRGRPTGYDADLVVQAFPNAKAVLMWDDLRKALGVPGSTFSRYKTRAVNEGIIYERSGGLFLTEQGQVLKSREATKAAAAAAS